VRRVRGGDFHLPSSPDVSHPPFGCSDHCLTMLLTGFDDFDPPDFCRYSDCPRLHLRKNHCRFDDSVRSTWHFRHYFPLR